MILKHKNYQAMGVLNLTPNSFSDGNSYFNEDSLISQFQNLNAWADIIDIGAESTAPMNKAISPVEELTRFEWCLDTLSSLETPKSLSIDTYKPEVFYEVYLMIKRIWPKTKLIWNDVSGCVDDDCLSLLKVLPDVSYVLCHNFTPQRVDTINHMEYTHSKFDITKEILSFYNLNTKKIKNHLILDLCFGFSKNREQNHRLFKFLNTFLNEFADYEHLIGISRKSFLRFPPIDSSKGEFNQNHLDALQGMILYQLNLNGPQFIYRVHDPKSFLLWDHLQEFEI